MSKIPSDLRYSEEHEYVKQTSDPAVVQIGITDYAQGELGDVVYVELPKLGATFGRMDVFGTIEAVKAVSDLYAPLAGTVTQVNTVLRRAPGAGKPGSLGWGVNDPAPDKGREGAKPTEGQ